jgi:DNA-binding NtrC family response regulator
MAMSDEQKVLAEAISDLVYCNPFQPERIEAERAALGDEFVAGDAAWNLGNNWETHPNIVRLRDIAANLVHSLRSGYGARPPRTRVERELYEAVVFFHLFHQFCPDFDQAIEVGLRAGGRRERVAIYGRFRAEADALLKFSGEPLWEDYKPEQLFAIFFQIRRAFFQIFRHLAGRSRPMARLRAAIWESIFTHDLRRFRRALFTRMGDMATLITGPTGTGKELVARAIGLSRFVPFDPKSQTFEEGFAGTFFPLNLAALSPTLIESELFGHRKGAFTGALQDREGWLEVCGAYGTVFLDEIGEVDLAVQVKLLRVLQERTFQRIGETNTRHFGGKIIGATNRDLAAEMEKGAFREDFYYRLCSDIIRTPSLAEQLADSPEELENLVGFISRRVVGEAEAEVFSREAVPWILKHLGAAYAWPGNFRELEQCLRNLVIRGAYEPPRPRSASGGGELAAAFERGELTADGLMRRYCSLLYASCRNYGEVARRLEVDRRTVRKYVAAGDEDAG